MTERQRHECERAIGDMRREQHALQQGIYNLERLLMPGPLASWTRDASGERLVSESAEIFLVRDSDMLYVVKSTGRCTWMRRGGEEPLSFTVYPGSDTYMMMQAADVAEVLGHDDLCDY